MKLLIHWRDENTIKSDESISLYSTLNEMSPLRLESTECMKTSLNIQFQFYNNTCNVIRIFGLRKCQSCYIILN